MMYQTADCLIVQLFTWRQDSADMWYLCSRKLWPQNCDKNQTVPVKIQSFTFDFQKQSWPVDAFSFLLNFPFPPSCCHELPFFICRLPVYGSLDCYVVYHSHDPSSSHTITITRVSLAFSEAAGLLLICSVGAATAFSDNGRRFCVFFFKCTFLPLMVWRGM